MRGTRKAKVAALAAASAFAAIFGGSAQAAAYIGVWAATYGSPFTNLGWRGTAEYFVPDTCVPGGTADVSNSPNCSGFAAVAAAQVELYDTTAGGQPTISTLVFNPVSMSVGTLRFTAGELMQLTTTFSNLENPGEDLSAFGVSSATEFSLYFTLDGPRLAWQDCDGQAPPTCTSGVNDAINFPATFTITRAPNGTVPEPTTLALLGLGLAGLAAARRRKQ